MDDMPPELAEFLISTAVNVDRRLISMARHHYVPTSSFSAVNNGFSIRFQICKGQVPSSQEWVLFVRMEMYRKDLAFPFYNQIMRPEELENSCILDSYTGIFKTIRINGPEEEEILDERAEVFQQKLEKVKAILADFLLKKQIKCVTMVYSIRFWYVNLFEILKPIRVVYLQGVNNLDEFLMPTLNEKAPKIFTFHIRQLLDIPDIKIILKKFERIEFARLRTANSNSRVTTNILDPINPCRTETTTQFCLNNVENLILQIESYMATMVHSHLPVFSFRFVVSDNRLPLGYRPTAIGSACPTYSNALHFTERFATWQIPTVLSEDLNLAYTTVPHSIVFHRVAKYSLPLVIITMMRSHPIGLHERGTEIMITIAHPKEYASLLSLYLKSINEVAEFSLSNLFGSATNKFRLNIARLYHHWRQLPARTS